MFFGGWLGFAAFEPGSRKDNLGSPLLRSGCKDLGNTHVVPPGASQRLTVPHSPPFHFDPVKTWTEVSIPSPYIKITVRGFGSKGLGSAVFGLGCSVFRGGGLGFATFEPGCRKDNLGLPLLRSGYEDLGKKHLYPTTAQVCQTVPPS